MIDLAALNEEQIEAVETVEGPLLVLAGAGSGKTRVITYRIANLLERGIHPSSILGVTFTNKAANEMKQRVHSLTHSQVHISTFHSLGALILRESIQALGYKNDFTIYDEDDVKKLLKTCLEELQIKDKKMEPKVFNRLISHAKNNLLSPDHDFTNQVPAEFNHFFPTVYKKYQEKLQEYNALDFDDLLYLTVKLFRNHHEILESYQERWKFLLVDEYQDTNGSQYEIVRLLVANSQNICVVGDPDQSIYSWRGADISNILNFESDFPGTKVIRLDRNYRSRTNILEAANTLIGYNSNRYEKHLWSDLGPGEKIKIYTGDTEVDEARFVAETILQLRDTHHIPFRDIVVFYRTNSQSRTFEDRFLNKRIPYVIVGGVSFYQRKEIKDILAFLRMVHSGADYISFSRTINLPKRGIGKTTIEKIRMGATQDGMTIYEFCHRLVNGESFIKLSAKQKQGLSQYCQIIDELKRINEDCSLKELVITAIEQSGYLSVLGEDPETLDDRKGNLDSLIAKAMEWESSVESPTLAGFLEELSLKSSLDDAEGNEDRVNLMTLHNGKGLEFPVVFLVGMEEDLFPHINTKDNEEAREEERRLCYVGMTRAKELLYLSNTRVRSLWGASRRQWPSRFLKEIPSKYLEKVQKSAPVREEEFIDDIDQTVEEVIFSPGDAIFHPQFGVGIVQRALQGSLGLTYQILFSKDNSVKNIVAKFATLSRI